MSPLCFGALPGPPARSQTRGMAHTRFRSLIHFLHNDEGAATAEYAVATMAAVGFAGLLVVILRGDEVKSILTDLVRRALTAGS
jgi:Flp pilus assembly pilin Flp